MDADVEVQWEGGKVIATTQAAAEAGLTVAVESLLTLANQTVPHDEGVLEGSGRAEVDGNALQAAMGWDGPYAVRLHEHPEYDFQGGRRGKWAELTLQEHGPRVIDWLAGELRKGLG